MPRKIKIPDYIKNHSLSFIWKPVWKRPNLRNKMWLAICCGMPGSGKSWSMLWLCKFLDPTFDISRVAFSPAQFTKLASSDLRRGSAILMDDSGLMMGSRDAMTQSSRELSKTLQSIRYKNYFLVLTLPAFSFLDKSARMLSNAYMEISRIDFEKRQTISKFQRIQTNPHSGVIYRHRPERIVEEVLPNGMVLQSREKCDFISFEEPDKELRMDYERLRKEYMDKRTRQSATLLEGLEAPKRKRLTFLDVYPTAEKEVDLLKDKIGNITDSLIMLRYGVGYTMAARIRDALRKRRKK